MASLLVSPSKVLGALLISYFSQTLPGQLGRQISSDILGRVLGSYGVDGPHQHCANMVPWVLGISI
jgi:hypothetical protein